MKNFFKKVAFVLALAMVLTNIGPATTASAAEAPSLRYKSRILYVGGSAFGDYTDNCWTPSQNIDGYTVAYSTNSTIIDLNTKNGKITANGTGVGLAVVNVTYTPVGGGQSIPATFNVKVRRNATDVKLAQAVVDELKLEEGLAVGTEVTLKAAKSATTPISYAKGNFGWDNYRGVVTDLVGYEVSNPDVIKVEGNTLTAVGAGEATLKVYTYEYLGASKDATKEREYKITVLGGVQSVKQTTVTKVNVEFAQELEETPAISEFKITKVSTNSNISVKGTKKDGKVITVETFVPMSDGVEYVLTYDGKDYSFIATDGKVEGLVINNNGTIPKDTLKEIAVDLVDKNGVVITTAKKNDLPYGITQFDIDVTNGYVLDNSLLLYAIGDKATVKVTYKTYEYNSTTGEEIGTIYKEFPIVAVAEDVTPEQIQYMIRDLDKGQPNWDNDASSASLCATDYKKMFVYQKNSKGEDLTQTGYIFESSNSDILIVDGRYPSIENKGVLFYVTGVKEGTAYVIVKNNAGAVVTTIPVTVTKAKDFSNFTLSATSVTLSNSNMLDDQNTKIKVQYKNQYDQDWGTSDDFVLKKLSGPGNDDYFVAVQGTGDDVNKVVIDAKGKLAGTYVYRVSKGNISRTITIVVQDANKYADANVYKPTYRLVTNGSNFNLAYNSQWDNGNIDVVVKVGDYRNGILYAYVAVDGSSPISVVGISAVGAGKELYPAGASDRAPVTVSGNSITISIRSIDAAVAELQSVTGTALVKRATGSYSVKLKVDGKDLSTGFSVTDDQKAVTAIIDSLTTSSADIDTVMKKLVTFRYDGNSVNDDVIVTKINTANGVATIEDLTTQNSVTTAQTIRAGQQIAVTTVEVLIKIDGKHYVRTTVSVNRTFTIN